MLSSTVNTEEAKILTERDIERLLAENTPGVRVDVVNRISDAHLNRRYSLHDFAIAEQVMRILVNDTHISVREALALRLKDNPYVPADIVVALTNKEESVALPVIENSPVLTDSDLVHLVSSCRNVAKQCAVAARKQVSKEVSAALVETHNSQVVSRLAKNQNADIPPDSYQTILRDHGQNKEIIQAVSERPNLPPTIVEKVLALVSKSVAEDIKTRYDIPQAVITEESDKHREVATLQLVDGGVEKPDVEKLVDQLRATGRLTPSIILTSLCRGNLYFFEVSLARLSSIPVKNAQLLIHDKGKLGFKALYIKAGLPDKFFEASKLLLDVVSDIKRRLPNLSGPTYANTIIHNLLDMSSGKSIENLSYIIALIRQSS